MDTYGIMKLRPAEPGPEISLYRVQRLDPQCSEPFRVCYAFLWLTPTPFHLLSFGELTQTETRP